ncbi:MULTISPECIES: hypothetical protein [Niastella]|uniref:Uncharacterized protein n=1 Tax=Niastella soli TaxID=2821487 RepID=A0ABS3YZ72_9BACT|nr:hypothetical protein [Niastella soli]MBO9203225.1 hypothetical protein [Niastella soli]
MKFFNRIFRSNMVDCPRCLGKGNVDVEDIKRLKKELFWAPGKCAYCNGIGKVPPDRIEKLSADFEYLTTDLPSWERLKVINGDKDALKRANEQKEVIQKIVEEIEHLYYIENKEPGEIAAYFFHKRGQFVYSASEKQEIIDYVDRVIKSKRKI